MKTTRTALYHLQAKDILYEDGDILVINKPASLPSQATVDPNRDNAYAAVLRYLRSRYGEKAYAGLHHRLDALTSGALLFTKAVSANASISSQFQEHTIEKTYCALCLGNPFPWESGESFRIDAPIGELSGSRIQKYGTDGRKRKPAQTDCVCTWSAQMRDGGSGLVICHPRTGRTHQIRVHLSSCGGSIIGDPLYGQPLLRSLRSIDPGRLCLHAESISFDHPSTGKRLTVSAPRPSEFDAFMRGADRIVRTLRKTEK